MVHENRLCRAFMPCAWCCLSDKRYQQPSYFILPKWACPNVVFTLTDPNKRTRFVRWNIVRMTAFNASVHLPGLHAHLSPTDQLVMFVYASCLCTHWFSIDLSVIRCCPPPIFVCCQLFGHTFAFLRSQYAMNKMCCYCTWYIVPKSWNMTLSSVFS
jgi:hypothetical protein